jgi:DNA-binding FadR family transcriptional regulator
VPLQIVEPLRLYRQIAGQIAALIDKGEFAAGSRLPAERELAALLGVSRTSVREAIISLEIAGRVEVRVGSGIFVAGPGAAQIAGLVDEGPSPFELLAARRLVEGEIVALAARSMKRADLAALRATIDRMREHADDFAKRDAADREFHVRIAAATGNGSLALVVEGLWQQRRGRLWSRIERYFHTTKMREGTLVDHAAIVAALERRDADGARQAMHRHLARVEREFQRNWDAIVPGRDLQDAARPVKRHG